MRKPFLTALVCIACAFFVAGCAKYQLVKVVPEDDSTQKTSTSALAVDEVKIDIDLARMPKKSRIRKINTQTMKIGARKTVVTGGDILRVLKYNEEVLELPKMSASKDFTITLNSPAASASDIESTIFGYSNVTYEVLSSAKGDDVLLLDRVFAVPEKTGRLSGDFYMPTDIPQVYKNVSATVKPADVSFKSIKRNKVIAASETHYVIKFVKKDGMSVLFEVRTLKGGSRPRVISREPVSIPLGTPIITIKGHQFKVHTITPDFIDIERLS
ncbi:hypothetical protein [Halodesulfovibrio marinisediminis]|nr:hypothetical protein [Halodesulfovibrio marinisediminis]